MKRFFTLLLVVIMVFGCFASCKKYDDENEKRSPTDTEMITERIETFLKAYNSGDMDKVLKCLDAKTRNAFQAMLNLLGGLAGSAAGFNIDLSDLFSLGVSTVSGDFMELEIADIKVIEKSTATVTTTMDLTGMGMMTIYFEMVYEDGGWYIHDMTDRKPAENNNPNNDSDGNNSTEENIHSYTISTCEPFVDGRAWVRYRDDKYREYYCVIDMQGNVIYSIINEGIKVFNIGKGSGIIRSNSKLILIDKSGEAKMELGENAEVKAYGDGVAWIYQNTSTITSLEHLYGIVDYSGKWIEPLTNLQEEGLIDNIEHIGNGFFAYDRWRDDVVYSIWNADGSVQITLDSIFTDCSIEFSNGMAFVESSIYYKDTLSVTVTKNSGKNNESKQTYKTSNDCIIYADGRFADLGEHVAKVDYDKAFYDGKVVTNEKIESEGGKYYQITDYTKKTPTTVEFTAYPASQIEDFIFNGDYGLVQIRGLDNEVYVTMIDANGNELITPIKGRELYYFILASDGYVYCYMNRNSGYYTRIDKNNNITETELTNILFEGNEGIGICDNYYASYYIKANGDKLFDNLIVQ